MHLEVFYVLPEYETELLICSFVKCLAICKSNRCLAILKLVEWLIPFRSIDTNKLRNNDVLNN